MSPIRILVADDHPIITRGVLAILREATDIEVVGDARTGVEAVRKTLELLPDIVLLDLEMPEMGGIQALRQIRLEHPEIRVLIFSMHKSNLHIRSAIEAGAAGYLVKDSDLPDLAAAVREVHAGGTPLSPSISRLVLDAYTRRSHAEPRSDVLSDREKQVLRLIAQEKTSREIAALLGVKLRTVDTHRANIKKKLKIHTLAGLVRYALEVGISEGGAMP